MDHYKDLMDIGDQYFREKQWSEAIEQLEIFDLNFLVLQFALLVKHTVKKHGMAKLFVNSNQNNMKIAQKGYLKYYLSDNSIVTIKLSNLILIM